MPRDPNNPLAQLIRRRLDELSLSQAELVLMLQKEGVNVTPSAVCHWLKGSGIAEAKRPAVASCLQVPLADLQHAALLRAQES